VWLPGFEPGSLAPEAKSLDQTSRQPLMRFPDPLSKTLLKVQHLSRASQRAVLYRLKRLNRDVDLRRTSFVESLIYGLNVSANYKNKLFYAYAHYCRANGITWMRPKKLRVKPYVVHVPTEERIDKVVACCGWVYSVVFSLSKYGLRPCEVAELTLRSFDLDPGTVTVASSKLGAQRTLKLKAETVAQVREYVNRRGLTKLSDQLFGSARKVKETWRKYRQRAYLKFRDPQLLKIRLYDLRHWYATKTYIQTRDIFLVKYLLGHRRIENTMLYVHLAKGLSSWSDEYTCKSARTVEEAETLIEAGFEYVTEIDGTMLFRKRK